MTSLNHFELLLTGIRNEMLSFNEGSKPRALWLMKWWLLERHHPSSSTLLTVLSVHSGAPAVPAKLAHGRQSRLSGHHDWNPERHL
jgi:hypothetical protein